jgi:restriction system protein
MIPDYQSLMRPVLVVCADGEIKVSQAVDHLARDLKLTDEERAELLPSGKQTVFANRVHWAKTYLKQAGLVRATRRGFFTITERGREILGDSSARINSSFLERFDEFQDFRNRRKADPDQVDDDGQDAVAKEENATRLDAHRERYRPDA